MNTDPDRLYNLLPPIYRERDEPQGFPLRAVLRAITEQADVVEADVAQLYENWFIETCQDWVVPYIADLIGHHAVHAGGEGSAEEALRTKFLVPRREVANTIGNRRRKGTLALLEDLAWQVAGWHARAVEFYRLLGWNQPLNHQHLKRGRLVNVRDAELVERIGTPFDGTSHLVDVRPIRTCSHAEAYNIPSVGLFVWRLESYSVTRTQAFCIDRRKGSYTFSILGNQMQLFTRPEREAEASHIAGEINVPAPIRRQTFEIRAQHTSQANPLYYGEAKSIQIHVGEQRDTAKPVPIDDIIPADLTHWYYHPPHGKVLVDPKLGRIVFGDEPDGIVWVSYQYGFSAALGGGEYQRPLSGAPDALLLRVGSGAGMLATIKDALSAASGKPNVIIEITESRLYEEPIAFAVPGNGTWQIRAAQRTRPVLRIPDDSARRDAFRVEMGPGSQLTLDGLLVFGRPVRVRTKSVSDPLPRLVIRHSTLVPGWLLGAHCHPQDGEEPSLELDNAAVRVEVEHSIVGSIFVNNDEVQTDPVPISITGSIVDATDTRFSPHPDHDRCRTLHAISSENCEIAHAVLTVERSTILGDVRVHAIKLAENSIFYGLVQVARRQTGCVRFCYVPEGSRTPRRYACQPDLVRQAVQKAGGDAALERAEELRVRPRFNSTRYGTPSYCQLACACACEIARGADDESEMGVFHDLFQPQRLQNLRKRLEEYTPANTDAGIIRAS